MEEEIEWSTYVVALVADVISLLLMAIPAMWAWNVTMPYLFGLPVLTYGRILFLMVLCRCLFGWRK